MLLQARELTFQLATRFGSGHERCRCVEHQCGGEHQYATTQIARVAGLYVTGTNGSGMLSVVGGGDVTLQGAQVRNAGTDGVIQLVAGHDQTLGTQTLAHSTDITDNSRNYHNAAARPRMSQRECKARATWCWR